MSFTHFRFETDADGVALVTWDSPGRSMNVLNAEVIEEIGKFVEHVASDAADQGRRHHLRQGGLLRRRRSLDARAAWARNTPRSPREQGEEAAMQAFYEGSRQLSLLYRKLETCGKPFAAAINGVCMGGGFELALACHYRVLADHDKARVGLPEIKVGLFPGAGGTQRVARLMPTPDALADAGQGRSDQAGGGEEDGPRARDRAAGRDRRQGQGLGAGQPGRQGAVGQPELQGAVRQGVLADGHDGLAGRQRALSPRDLRQLSRRARDPVQRLRGPATADGSRAGGREPLFREDPALEGSGGDDPLAVPVDGRTQQGRAAAGGRAGDFAEEDRRDRRRLHGRGRRLCHRQRRARRRADRSRPGERRQGQGAFGEADLLADRQGPRQGAPTATRCSRASPRPPIMRR